MYNTYCIFQAPYRIEMDVSALLLVDIHGHLSPKCEVIGLLGGVFRPLENTLCIKMAVPCRTILSSNVHCDMCPGKFNFFYSTRGHPNPFLVCSLVHRPCFFILYIFLLLIFLKRSSKQIKLQIGIHFVRKQ